MKFTKEQFCNYVNKYKEMLDQEQQIVNALNLDSCEWAPSVWLVNYYEMLSDLCELQEDSFYGTILDWYCFEVDFGRDEENNKIYNPVKDTLIKITTPKDLYNYILQMNKGK